MWFQWYVCVQLERCLQFGGSTAYVRTYICTYAHMPPEGRFVRVAVFLCVLSCMGTVIVTVDLVFLPYAVDSCHY